MTQIVIVAVVVLFWFGYRRSERLARELREQPSRAEQCLRGPSVLDGLRNYRSVLDRFRTPREGPRP